MDKRFESIKATRQFLLKLVENLSTDQLNEVPAGFNNNIIWNLAHIVAAQQGVCYKRAGLATAVPEDFFQEFKPDTKPGRKIDSDEVSMIKEMLISTIDTLINDYKAGHFATYPAWTTRYGVELTGIDDALTFLPFHEGLHFGYVMALKRVVAK
jgi:hypothetical protein